MPVESAKPDVPVEHSFDSTGEAYDASQTWDAIKDGDILIVPSERVVGVLIEAWPTAVGEESGEFHATVKDFDWAKVPTTASGYTDTKDYSESFQMAVRALDRILLAIADAKWDQEGL